MRAGGRMHQRIFPPGTAIGVAQAWRNHVRATNPNKPRIRPHEQTLMPSIDGWCYLYFVRQGEAVKIGRASNVQRRIEELQTASPTPLELLVAVPAHASLEKEYLKRLEPYRLNGEWFLSVPLIERLVISLQDGANPVGLLFSWHQLLTPAY